jgi:hypothetical protein
VAEFPDARDSLARPADFAVPTHGAATETYGRIASMMSRVKSLLLEGDRKSCGPPLEPGDPVIHAALRPKPLTVRLSRGPPTMPGLGLRGLRGPCQALARKLRRPRSTRRFPRRPRGGRNPARAPKPAADRRGHPALLCGLCWALLRGHLGQAAERDSHLVRQECRFVGAFSTRRISSRPISAKAVFPSRRPTAPESTLGTR